MRRIRPSLRTKLAMSSAAHALGIRTSRQNGRGRYRLVGLLRPIFELPSHTSCQAFIKQLAPEKLVVDGTYGVNRAHLNINTIDIFSDHYYPPNNTKLQEDIALVETVNKVYLVGEYDWTGNNAQGDSLRSFYDIIEGRQNTANPVVAGDIFWSLFMHDVPNCNIYVNHSDGFALQYGNPANTAQNNSQITLIRQHFFQMQGVNVDNYLPCVPCPG